MYLRRQTCPESRRCPGHHLSCLLGSLKALGLSGTLVVRTEEATEEKRQKRTTYMQYVRATGCADKRTTCSPQTVQSRRGGRTAPSALFSRLELPRADPGRALVLGMSDGPYRAPSSPPLTPHPTNRMPLALRSRHRLYGENKDVMMPPPKKGSPIQ